MDHLNDFFDTVESTARRLVTDAERLQARAHALDTRAVFALATDDPVNAEAFAMSRLQWIVSEHLAPAIQELSELRTSSLGHSRDAP